MCGIVGYVKSNDNNADTAQVLLNALEKLEYRGYDSAGLAVLSENGIDFIKAKGRIANLRSLVAKRKDFAVNARVGIGHTRWATHGEPNDINSHPHLSSSNHVAVVHNGIIENYIELRDFLLEKGYEFASQTDTEVIANLVDYCYTEADPKVAVREAANMLMGSYAIAVIFADAPNTIIAFRKDSPLIIGLCDDENILASDATAVLEHTRNILRLDESELAVISATNVSVYNHYGVKVQKEIQHIMWDAQAIEKGGFEHFMMKEIFQQPQTIHQTAYTYTRDGRIDFNLKNIDDEYLSQINSICIVACGSAYHVGVVGTTLMERYIHIPVRCAIASEFIYSDPIIDSNTLTLVISQSGETADTLHAMRTARARGSKSIAIVNVLASTIAVESDDCIYTMAGPEIAVATTKAYSAQLIIIYMLMAHIAKVRGLNTISEAACLEQINALPMLINGLLEQKQSIQQLASMYRACEDIFFLGRNLDYALALEGSLKLKEISYIHSEAYAAGELKHGTISLIENGSLVIACCTYEPLLNKMIDSINEVKSRGARVIALAYDGAPSIENVVDHVIWIPKSADFVKPSLTIVPLQLFAYYVALLRGCDIDKPRNLAKSVTVG